VSGLSPPSFDPAGNPLREAWRRRSLLLELARREFAGRYRGSFGGILWSFAQPLFLLGVYTLAFGVILRARWGFAGGTADYALLLFAGLIVFNAFSECLNRAPTLVTAKPNFVKKVVFPLEMLAWVSAITALFHALIALAIWLAGYALFYGWPKPSVLWFPMIFAALLPVLLGIGWLLSAIGVFVRDIGHLTGLVSHALLFLTPIFFSIEAAPGGLQPLLMANPLTFLVEQFRLILYVGQPPNANGLAVYFALACAFAWFSLMVFRRLRASFADLV
jgi:lipopolysaccharide transport system permease protein